MGPAAVAAVLTLLVLLGAGTTALQLTGAPSAAVLVPAALALASGTGAAVLATGARRLPGRAGRPWRAMALAAGLLALGQVLAVARAGRDLAAGGVEEAPTVLAVPVAVAVAVLLLPPRAGRRVGSRVLLDGAVVTIAVGVLGGVVLDDLLDQLLGETAGPGHGLIAAGYPLVGAVLCGVGLVAVTAVPEARRRSATWLLGSFLAMATVAVSGAVSRTSGGAAGPGWSVVTVLAWLAMLGTGLCAAAADRAATAPGGRRALPVRGAVLAHVAATAALLAVTGGVVAGRPVPAPEAAAAVALLLLTSARTLSWALDAARLTRRLERTEGWFRALVHSGDAVTVVLDAAGRVTSVSGPVAAQLGRAEDELVGHELIALLHPDDRDLVERVAAALRDGCPDGLPATGRLAGTHGGWRDVEVSGAARTGGRRADDGLVLHLRDVTERRAGQRELERLAYTDSLTGLPNRARFMAALEGALDRAARGRRSCVLLVDLDGFKSVNDVAGHDAGDRLLCEVADALRAEARSGDLVARLGGDEFALLVDAGPDAAMALAERLVARLDVSRRYDGADGGQAGPVFRVSASVGLAEVVTGADASATVREADLALRTVKAEGKNGVRASGEGLVEAAARRSRLARDLPGAIARGDLHLVYQPVAGVRERRVLGVEALVRWDHPVLGPVPPEEFIGLAEDDGLVVPLQRWVLETATAEHARLVAAGRDLKLGVNVSVRHLQARCLVEDVTRALERSGLPARLLMVEVTESVLMDDDERLLAELAELSALGCLVSLDDFGKGYSSLAYLARLPVDVLKMDRGFVSGIDTDPRGAALVGSVVDLGRTLGMDVVAEGVETAAQREVLVSLGCGFLQGWLTGRPVPAPDLPAVVDGFDPDLLGGRQEQLPVP
ncbi:putative bifunctional diguanylate cyclase/phosphodiesterase [Geodermatophilus telluris]|uniref:putative bifunctional diguanylate cyclase/phosphodiesterase n=1 Tax=Geodermatophilus telluris TaxID=1190417 RepID=UPI001C31B029|nr:EAL domain-containing protein [Geodermatophilus telluris]